jgi:uncharacterized membrane protein
VDFLRGGTLVAATLTTGLTAGLFYSFSVAVMPGLAQNDDRSFVGGMQGINRAIQNGWFFLSFMGALLFSAAALFFHLRGGATKAVPWIIAGLVLYFVVLVITFALNIPLNNELEAAGNGHPDGIADLAEVRRHFESTWVALNHVRTIVNTAAFGSLMWALVQYGRTVA